MRVCPRCRSIYSTPVDRCGIDGTQIVEQDEDPLVGEEIDRYRILEPLGRGAMGCVYRASHSVLENPCAIKVLYGNFALNQRLIERFRREAQAIGKMDHPNIVDVIDFGRTGAGLTFLVMELVEGWTLEEAIEKEAPFTPVRAAQIARQIASGLGEAHRRGFVHRDMKPSNIMLTTGRELDVVKILDFGVVGLIQAAAGQKLTAVGHIVGTPTYMAPEQARSSTVGPPADLYALGVILYEMLSGRPPFEGNGIAEVLLKHLNEDAAPLPELKGLERITAALLEKKPDRRLGNATRVIAEIDRLNLQIAKTEQILISNVLKTVPKIGREFNETVEFETEQHPLEEIKRHTVPMPHVEQEPTDPHLGMAGDPSAPVELRADDTDKSPVAPRERGVAKDPSDEDRPRLVAPSLVDLHAPPEGGMDAPTQLDLRLDRPAIGPDLANLISHSSVDTAPPDAAENATEAMPSIDPEEHVTDNVPKRIVERIAERTILDTPHSGLRAEPRVMPSPLSSGNVSPPARDRIPSGESAPAKRESPSRDRLAASGGSALPSRDPMTGSGSHRTRPISKSGGLEAPRVPASSSPGANAGSFSATFMPSETAPNVLPPASATVPMVSNATVPAAGPQQALQTMRAPSGPGAASAPTSPSAGPPPSAQPMFAPLPQTIAPVLPQTIAPVLGPTIAPASARAMSPRPAVQRAVPETAESALETQPSRVMKAPRAEQRMKRIIIWMLVMLALGAVSVWGFLLLRARLAG